MRILLIITFFCISPFYTKLYSQVNDQKKPNILFAIADDQSFPHASAYGQPTFITPNFDMVAKKGIIFNNAFVAAPQCSPSRAAILTGRQIWQIEEAGTHASYFPKKFPVFTNSLESSGYLIGYTGKPWDPGNFEDAGWDRNPVGPEYNKRELKKTPTKGISKIDYAANFKDFLQERKKDQPFFFWYGSHEPHRKYEEGSGAAAGLTSNGLQVPSFLPNENLVKQDMLDYALEIQWFDKQLGKMIKMLEESGELENTIIVITADNGMAFPYAKANMQEYGIHVPLAICGPGINGPNRKEDALVSLIDLAPTFLDMAGVQHFKGITGKSLKNILQNTASSKKQPERNYILSGRERHSHSRPDNVGYPSRAIRTQEYLYIKNYAVDRWPAGNPPPKDFTPVAGDSDMKPILEGYEDIDDSPTKSYMISNRQTFTDLFQLGFEKRDEDQLYDIVKDPFCMHDLAKQEKYKPVLVKLKKELEKKLKEQGDPRENGNGDIFESYPRFGLMRPFEGFKERGKYNSKYIKK